MPSPETALPVSVPQHLDEETTGGINEIAQQLAFSDLILLNKTDLVDEEQLDVVKSAVRRINQSAQLVECRLNQEGGQPPLSLLLENNSFSVNKALQVDPEFLHSDSGSELDDSDSDSDSDSEGEGGAEGGEYPAAACGPAAGEASGSTARNAAGGCCDAHHHKHKKQRLEHSETAAADADAQRRESGQQAESSAQTSQTVGPCVSEAAAGQKGNAAGAGTCTGEDNCGLNKVRAAHQHWHQGSRLECSSRGCYGFVHELSIFAAQSAWLQTYCAPMHC